MLWIALAAAAATQMSMPEPKYMWLSMDDTPVHEITGKFLRVQLRLTIPPDGRVQACEIEQSSGNPQVDKYTCDLARRRALFRPALSAAGAATYGIYRIPIVWAKEPAKFPRVQDLTVALPSRPKGTHLPVTVRVMFSVRSDGKISDCTDLQPLLAGLDQNDPALVPIACDQVVKRFTPVVAKDDEGKSVDSVQSASVLITKD